MTTEPSSNHSIELSISDIKVGKRLRHDYGDIQGLAEDIKTLGLLQPIGVTPERRLVFGERRLRACRDLLGWNTIRANVVNVRSIIEGEIAENCCREQYRISELVSIVDELRTFAHGGDRRSDQEHSSNLDLLTVDAAAKRVGLGGKHSYYRAKRVLGNGVPELVEAMDQREIPLAVAAEIAKLPDTMQRQRLAEQLGRVATEALAAGHDPQQSDDAAPSVAQPLVEAGEPQRVGTDDSVQSATARANADEPESKDDNQPLKQPVRQPCTLTADGACVACDLLIVDPPYGITNEPWEHESLESFTREWASKWNSCGADFIVVFLSQRYMWEGRRWLDESLSNYGFQQTAAWHAPNTMRPKSRAWLKQSWELIFVYRRKGCEQRIHDTGSVWTSELHDLDCHIASVPQSNYGGHDRKVHLCQKPVSVMKWLVNALSKPGQKVVSLFCGSAPCGIATLQLGRQYHGIEQDEKQRSTAQARMSAYGQPDQAPKASDVTVPLNSVTHGDCLDLIPCLPDRSVDLVVASPPYSERRKEQYPSIAERHYPEFTLRWMSCLWKKLTDQASVFIVIDPHVTKGVMSDYVLRTQLTLREAGWNQHRTQIWYKPDVLPLGHKGWPRHAYEQILWFSKSNRPYCDPKACGGPSERFGVNRYAYSNWSKGDSRKQIGTARATDVISVPIGANDKGVPHPAKFPVPLAARLIETYCSKDGTVLDPFCGSGSTLVAANRQGRSFYGFDVMGNFCELARKRLDDGNEELPPREAG